MARSLNAVPAAPGKVGAAEGQASQGPATRIARAGAFFYPERGLFLRCKPVGLPVSTGGTLKQQALPITHITGKPQGGVRSYIGADKCYYRHQYLCVKSSVWRNASRKSDELAAAAAGAGRWQPGSKKVRLAGRHGHLGTLYRRRAHGALVPVDLLEAPANAVKERTCLSILTSGRGPSSSVHRRAVTNRPIHLRVFHLQAPGGILRPWQFSVHGARGRDECRDGVSRSCGAC